MIVTDLGSMRYRDAWQRQEQAHEAVCAGGEDRLLLVEHPPVITLGRRPGGQKHIVAATEALERMGVEVVQSDRGGDVTFHGPGQIVAYPIVRLEAHGLMVGGYVRTLVEAVIATLGRFGIAAQADPSAIGAWVGSNKICAFGVRIRRGVSLHGLALNVRTDLRYFDLIVPCGLRARGVTSMEQILGDRSPGVEEVKGVLVEMVRKRLDPPSRPSP